ncbi:hypothetical protein [Escherichia coli]|uniref:hypothetical protein n=1 Tax=Escherichia coli TaxID=562 RepID=UPI0020CEF5C9|nr:hypothetical protein [Escherichia coli]
MILWFPLLIWWTPLCLIRQILTRRFRLYAYIDKNLHAAAKKMNVNNLIALKPAVVIGILLEVLASLPVKDDLTNGD